jgi:hypothetical protein
VSETGTEFDMPFTGGHVTFNREAEGRVSGVLIRVSDGERELRRVAPGTAKTADNTILANCRDRLPRPALGREGRGEGACRAPGRSERH